MHNLGKVTIAKRIREKPRFKTKSCNRFIDKSHLVFGKRRFDIFQKRVSFCRRKIYSNALSLRRLFDYYQVKSIILVPQRPKAPVPLILWRR